MYLETTSNMSYDTQLPCELLRLIYIFGLWSEYISKCMHAWLQVSICN